MWSSGFPDIAVLKPMCVLASLRLGYDVLWMDTDVVTLRSPLADLDPQADMSIQVGAAHPTEVARTSEQVGRRDRQPACMTCAWCHVGLVVPGPPQPCCASVDVRPSGASCARASTVCGRRR